MPKRSYTLRTKQARYDAIVAKIKWLEAAHNKRYERIGKLREKAQHLANRLAMPGKPEQPQEASDAGPAAQ